MDRKPSPLPTAARVSREAEALRENLAKRKQQARARQTADEAPESHKESTDARDA
jgi:hypothetical protein